MVAPVAVDADQHSVTVAWEEVPGAIAYELQVAVPSLTGAGAQPPGSTEQEEEWTSLSSSCKWLHERQNDISPLRNVLKVAPNDGRPRFTRIYCLSQ